MQCIAAKESGIRMAEAKPVGKTKLEANDNHMCEYIFFTEKNEREDE